MAELFGRVDRLLPRQGRVDAHRRLLGRHARRERDRRRRLRHRDRGGARRCGCAAPTASSSASSATARVNQGAFLENANYAAIHRAAGRLRLREQRLRDVDAVGTLDGARSAVGPRRRPSASRASPSTGWMSLATYAGGRRPRSPRRAGEGPTLVVADCYRFDGHHVGDPENYREPDEAARWQARDPIAAFRDTARRRGPARPRPRPTRSWPPSERADRGRRRRRRSRARRRRARRGVR